MSNLKDLTWEHHKDAERQEFVKVLMSGKLILIYMPHTYGTNIKNMTC